MWHRKALWAARCVLGEVWLHVHPKSELRRWTMDWIQHMTESETCQRGDNLPHVVVPTDLGYMLLAFHVEGFQPLSVGGE